jgi:PhnB protein
MGKVTLDPYLFFTGNCREAMEFYKKVFGGTLEVQTYDEVPGDMPEGMSGKVMHASLRGGAVTLLGSDTTKASARAAKISLCLGGSDEPALSKIFESLSEGAEVNQPLKKEFWGDTFGSLTDRFGVDWMVNIAAKKE